MEGERVTLPGLLIGTVLLALAILGVQASTVGRALWVVSGVALVGAVLWAIRGES